MAVQVMPVLCKPTPPPKGGYHAKAAHLGEDRFVPPPKPSHNSVLDSSNRRGAILETRGDQAMIIGRVTPIQTIVALKMQNNITRAC